MIYVIKGLFVIQGQDTRHSICSVRGQSPTVDDSTKASTVEQPDSSPSIAELVYQVVCQMQDVLAHNSISVLCPNHQQALSERPGVNMCQMSAIVH